MTRLFGALAFLVLVSLALSLAAPSVGDAPQRAMTDPAVPVEARIHFLAVQTGSAILVEVGERRVLIDGGDSQSGARILTYLRSEEIEDLDAVILTVGRAEHAGGLIPILQEIPVGQLLVPEPVDEDPLARSVERLAGRLGIPVRRAVRGLQLEFGSDLLEVLVPVEELISGSGADAANNSVVLRLSAGGIRALFPGDLAAAGEERLRRLESNLHADLLQVPAHGDRQGSGLLFLQAVQPQVAVISTGEYNGAYPDQAVLDRLERVGSKVYRTDLHGTVVVEIQRGEMTIHLRKAETS